MHQARCAARAASVANFRLRLAARHASRAQAAVAGRVWRALGHLVASVQHARQVSFGGVHQHFRASHAQSGSTRIRPGPRAANHAAHATAVRATSAVVRLRACARCVHRVRSSTPRCSHARRVRLDSFRTRAMLRTARRALVANSRRSRRKHRARNTRSALWASLKRSSRASLATASVRHVLRGNFRT